MPSITKAQAAQLGRRAQQPTLEPGELLAIFVPGKLKNPLNGPQWGKQKFSQMRYRKTWKERVELTLFERAHMMEDVGFHPGPKRVTFRAGTHNAMDTDGLQAALKPVRDALVECGVISGDAERDGNKFVYEQRIDRKRRGVEIRVALRPTSVAERTRL
jgi:hypothetical protein